MIVIYIKIIVNFKIFRMTDKNMQACNQSFAISLGIFSFWVNFLLLLLL